MANYLPNLPVKLKVARGKLEKYAREKFKIARGKSQKYAREAQQLPVANQQIKKFHGQQNASQGKKRTLMDDCKKAGEHANSRDFLLKITYGGLVNFSTSRYHAFIVSSF